MINDNEKRHISDRENDEAGENYCVDNELGFEFLDHGEYYEITRSTKDITDIIIPANYKSKPIKRIKAYAFSGSKRLEVVKIHEGVTDIGEGAFKGCEFLSVVELPESLTKLGDGTFMNCTSLLDIALPTGLNEISDNLFSGCDRLMSIEIPTSVSVIGSGAFKNCASLNKLMLPKEVTSVSKDAFDTTLYGEKGVISVYYLGSATDTQKNKISVSGNARFYSYSEKKPLFNTRCWHYVNKKIEIWESTFGKVGEFFTGIGDKIKGFFKETIPKIPKKLGELLKEAEKVLIEIGKTLWEIIKALFGVS